MGNTFGFQLAKCFHSQSEQLLGSIVVDAQKFMLYGHAKITILLKLAHSSVSTFRHPFDIKENLQTLTSLRDNTEKNLTFSLMFIHNTKGSI